MYTCSFRQRRGEPRFRISILTLDTTMEARLSARKVARSTLPRASRDFASAPLPTVHLPSCVCTCLSPGRYVLYCPCVFSRPRPPQQSVRCASAINVCNVASAPADSTLADLLSAYPSSFGTANEHVLTPECGA